MSEQTPEQRLDILRTMNNRREKRRRDRAWWKARGQEEKEQRERDQQQQEHREAGRDAPDQKLAWIYARASHRSNSDTDSVSAQIDRCKRRFHASWEARGYALAKVQPDLVTSASKVAFFNRNSGGTIGRLAQADDVILVDKMDRIFRSTKDFILTQEDLDSRGILLEIGDCAFCSDPNNPFYRVMIVMMSQFAEMESRRLSYRIKESFSRRTEAGASITAKVPAGLWLVKRKRDGYGQKPLSFLEWNVWERSLMNAVCQKADLENWSCKDVTEWLNHVVLRGENVKQKSCWMKYPVTRNHTLRLYFWEKIWRLYGVTDADETKKFQNPSHWEYGRPVRNWERLQKMGWLPLPE